MEVKKNYYSLYLLGAAILLASIVVRVLLFPLVSVDYTTSLVHWMDALHGGPWLSAFKNPFSDYTPFYLYFLKILATLPFYYLYSIKTLSFIFDIGLGIVGVMIARKKTPALPTSALFLVFALIVSIPTVILNSAAWAQVDALYTFCVLVSLYYILEDRPLAATIAFSIAISFKLQAIFFLPVLIGYLLNRIKKVWYLILIPIIFAITIIPAWLGGGSFSSLFTTYIHQTQEAPLLTRSAPSVFSFFDQNTISADVHPLAPKIGIAVALVVCLVIILLVAWFNQESSLRKRYLIGLSLISVIAIPFFLPYMHERYFYIADVLSVIFVFYEPYLFFVPFAVIAASFFSYMPFLSATAPQFGPFITNEGYLGGLMLFALISLVVWFYSRWKIRTT